MKSHSKSIEEHVEVPLADDGQLEALVKRWDLEPDDTPLSRDGGLV